VVVSVVMAVYNTDFHLVKRAIDSVLTQDFQDFELIIVDDGSEIDAENQLLNYAKKFEDKITYLRHKNKGQSVSINRAILNSCGKYISILDADDEYKSTHLRACLQEMKSADLIASTTETIVDKEEDYYVPDKFDPFEVIHVDDCILFATLFGKKEIFTTISFCDMYGADALFYENAAKKYQVRKVNLKTYIYYRNIPGSLCATLKRKNLSAFV
jgi:glycosyltransferase involved in cell wall biosynthesis